MSDKVQFQAIGHDTDTTRYRLLRRMLVGPWCNQPEEYEGYNGFVGWSGLTRLRSGRWLVTFSSGYWHASFPLTEEVLKDPRSRELFDYYRTLGCPYVRAPRGGRAHIMQSDDQGLTWSKPATLIDTEMDDRHPGVLELDDGTLLCTFFQYRLPETAFARYILSHDGGKTWTDVMAPEGNPRGGFGNNPAIQLRDGTVVWVIEGPFDGNTKHEQIGVYRSTDRGRTFKQASVLRTDHTMEEPTIAQLPTGRLVTISRRKDDITFSDDGGSTWTEPVSIGVELFDPHLVVLPTGVLACFHGSYQTGGIRALLSPDGGRTWNGPMPTCGYAVDPSVYGYSNPLVLPDGSVGVVYLHTGGHRAADARTEALWLARVKVSEKADGIELLPAPGSPAALGAAPAALESLATQGGDPELGELRDKSR